MSDGVRVSTLTRPPRRAPLERRTRSACGHWAADARDFLASHLQHGVLPPTAARAAPNEVTEPPAHPDGERVPTEYWHFVRERIRSRRQPVMSLTEDPERSGAAERVQRGKFMHRGQDGARNAEKQGLIAREKTLSTRGAGACAKDVQKSCSDGASMTYARWRRFRVGVEGAHERHAPRVPAHPGTLVKLLRWLVTVVDGTGELDHGLGAGPSHGVLQK